MLGFWSSFLLDLGACFACDIVLYTFEVMGPNVDSSCSKMTHD